MPATQENSIIILRKNEFLTNSGSSRWSDPKGIAAVPERIREVVLSNPSLGEDDPVQLVGLKGESVIGSSLALSGRMVVDGHEHPVSWGSNLYADPAARRTMIGLKLVKAFQELFPTSAVCGVSQAGHALYKSFGWTDFVMPRHILLRHSRSVLERKFGAGTLSRWLRIPVDLALKAFNWRLLRPQSRRIDWRTWDEAPPEVGQRLASVPGTRKNTFVPRREETVKWQLHGCVPGARGDCNFLVTVYAGASLVGYAGAKVKFFPVASAQGFKNLRLGSLYDWMIFDRELLSYRDLAACASRELIARGADAVELCATDREEEAALRSMWLPRMGENRLMWKAAKGSILDDARFRHREGWTIRPGDADLFM